jgi:S1-C subfamily serine protease
MLARTAIVLTVAWLICAMFLGNGLAQSDSDRILEVPPRIARPAPLSDIDNDRTGAEGASAATNNDAATAGADHNSSASSDSMPYLGLSVQYIMTEGPDGREVHGLEVVGVDPNSPAEEAGFRAQGSPTKLGASGATAGALMPPLDLIVMPLLKKAGDLGQTGDLIVAIDDNRVSAPDDLRTVLETLKPGDVIYFTLVRLKQNASPETLKLPVKLGAPRDAAGNLLSEAAKRQ